MLEFHVHDQAVDFDSQALVRMRGLIEDLSRHLRLRCWAMAVHDSEELEHAAATLRRSVEALERASTLTRRPLKPEGE